MSDASNIIRTTWALVEKDADAAMTLFYSKLFDRAPQVKPLFDGIDMARQKRMLGTAIAVFVRSPGLPDSLADELRAMGRRHVGYGAEPFHYDVVGQALLATLAEGLGDAFTPEAEAAWTEAYTTIAGLMLEGDAEARAIAAE